jgi:hypothetical protein
LDQEIGQDRQGLPAFDNPYDLLQWIEQGFSLDAETHGGSPIQFG